MNKKSLQVIAALTVSCAMLFGSMWQGRCTIIDKIAAVVNGEIITQQEVAWLLMPYYERYKKEYTGRHLADKMQEAEKTVLDQLIDDKLILSEAKRQGVEVADKEIEIKLDDLKKRFSNEDEFRATLSRQNVTLSELRDKIKNDLIKSKLVRVEIGWKVVISPTDVREYYDTHIDEFTTEEAVRIQNLLIKKDDAKRTVEEAKFLITKLKELVQLGEDFGQLVKEYSEGSNVNGGGGLGLVKRGEMMEEIDNAIFSLETGETSDIVESPLGYHLFNVTEKIDKKTVPFEEAKVHIEDLIYKSKIEKTLQKWLRELRKNAYISIK